MDGGFSSLCDQVTLDKIVFICRMVPMIRIEHNSLSAGLTADTRERWSDAIDRAFDLVTSGCPVELIAHNESPIVDGCLLATVWFDGGIDYSLQGIIVRRNHEVGL